MLHDSDKTASDKTGAIQSKQIKPSFTIQLCCYQDMLTPLQGRMADEFVIALGDGEQARLRITDYFYYYQSLKRSFLNSQQHFNLADRPNPVDSSSWGRWSTVAEQQLQDCDHLSLVATMSRSQIRKLEHVEIDTAQRLIDTELDHIPGMNNATFNRLKAQASLQRASEGLDTPLFEVITPGTDSKQGLALLPPHSNFDVFFDIEGFPLDDGGLEYLWGNSYFEVTETGERGERKFKQAGSDSYYLLGHEDEAGKNLKAKWIRPESNMQAGLIVLQAKTELPEIISLNT
jgi:uncharacterized protein